MYGIKYIKKKTTVAITGKPIRCSPNSFSKIYRGFDFDTLSRNMKLVPYIEFKIAAGITNRSNNTIHFGNCFASSLKLFPAVSTIGYKANNICIVTLCICIKFKNGSFVQVGKINAAREAGIHIA